MRTTPKVRALINQIARLSGDELKEVMYHFGPCEGAEQIASALQKARNLINDSGASLSPRYEFINDHTAFLSCYHSGGWTMESLSRLRPGDIFREFFSDSLYWIVLTNGAYDPAPNGDPHAETLSGFSAVALTSSDPEDAEYLSVDGVPVRPGDTWTINGGYDTYSIAPRLTEAA